MTRAVILLAAYVVGVAALAAATVEERKRPNYPPLFGIFLLTIALLTSFVAGVVP